MFILLVLILTFIAISLKISASGVELASKVAFRSSKNNKTVGVARLGIATSATLMRVIAFIISRIRDVISLVGSFVILVDVVIAIIIIVVASSNIALFTTLDESGNLMMNTTSLMMGQTSGSTSSGSLVNNGTGSISKPAGLSDESWSKADAIGKKIVAFASNAILNPPNGKYLLYRQGDTPVGYADCSVFVCSVFEGALNKTFSGVDAPNGYDFSKNRKSDLKGYVTTYGMEDILRKKPNAKIGTTRSSLDSALPGDVLLTDGHVGIYIGKNEKGDHVMVHASTSTNPNCKGDIMLADGQKLQVGFSGIRRTFTIIRPSILLGY